MHEVNAATYKRNLYRLEEQMKERAEKIRRLEEELGREREEKARLVEALADIVNTVEANNGIHPHAFEQKIQAMNDMFVSLDFARAALQPKPEAV